MKKFILGLIVSITCLLSNVTAQTVGHVPPDLTNPYCPYVCPPCPQAPECAVGYHRDTDCAAICCATWTTGMTSNAHLCCLVWNLAVADYLAELDVISAAEVQCFIACAGNQACITGCATTANTANTANEAQLARLKGRLKTYSDTAEAKLLTAYLECCAG